MSFSEIEEALGEIAQEAAHLAARLQRLDAGETLTPGSQAEWQASLVCSSATVKIYTGCERIMAALAKILDSEKIIHEGSWHRALLDRKQRPFVARAAIISHETFETLDRMRAFRHRERNSYGHGLRFDIVAERAREMIKGFELFGANVCRFMNNPRAGAPGHESRHARRKGVLF